MSFKLDLSKAVENIKEDAEKTIRGTLIGISTRIIKRTPVGNPALWKSKPPEGYVGGSLRGAWQASVGAPDLTPTNRKEKSENGGATAVEASAVANNIALGQTFFLTNNLPYATRVEFGWSSQRPMGMLRVSIAEANRALSEAAKK
jgi:hypothetical protein